MKALAKVEILPRKLADCKIKKLHKIEVLRSERYCVVEGYSIRGEAPKSFIKVQESNSFASKRNLGIQNKKNLVRTPKNKKMVVLKKDANFENWTLYIAKTGHKWYPIESITEHLIARIGTILGLEMAFSRLVMIGNQIRFLSRYFINHESQELIHGADILATYFSDRPFVEEVQKKKRESEFFTLDTVSDSIKASFPNDSVLILENYFLMLIFDCWVGVQDRHFENWGIIRSIYSHEAPRFSPIYDSARGLFWNETEQKIREWFKYKQVVDQIEILARKSMPQVGLRSVKVNHFELAEEILTDKYVPIKAKAKLIFTDNALRNVKKMIEKDFKYILSDIRIELINTCLEIRFLKLKKLLL